MRARRAGTGHGRRCNLRAALHGQPASAPGRPNGRPPSVGGGSSEGIGRRRRLPSVRQCGNKRPSVAHRTGPGRGRTGGRGEAPLEASVTPSRPTPESGGSACRPTKPTLCERGRWPGSTVVRCHAAARRRRRADSRVQTVTSAAAARSTARPELNQARPAGTA